MQILQPSEYLGNNQKTLNSNGLWVGITEYGKENLPNFSWHSHTNDHISFLLKGGTLVKRNCGEQAATSGDLLFFHSDEAHQNSNTPFGSKNLNIEFEPEFLKSYDLQINVLKQSLTTLHSKFILLKILKELHSPDRFSSDSITLLILTLFGDQKPLRARSAPKWVKIAREYLYDHTAGQTSLEELSNLTGIHPVTISKYFSKHFSCTLGEFMRRLKTEKALILLQKGKLSLGDVAYECGFSDQSHFTRTFKNLTGLSPRQYAQLIHS